MRAASSITAGIAPALLGQRALRTGIGLLLLVQGVVLAGIAVSGPPGDLEQLGIDGFILTLGAAVAMLATIERRGDRADLDGRRAGRRPRDAGPWAALDQPVEGDIPTSSVR